MPGAARSRMPDINPADLRIDYLPFSGAGRSARINTTSTPNIRITYPSGIVVEVPGRARSAKQSQGSSVLARIRAAEVAASAGGSLHRAASGWLVATAATCCHL